MTKTQFAKLKDDWKKYNAQYKSQPKLRMTYAEYESWVMGTVKKPTTHKSLDNTFGRPVWANANNIPSLIGTSKTNMSRNSMVEKVTRGEITGEAADQVMAKSKRIGIAFSKGGYQYITEDTDLKTLGKKSQQL
jgi:hypothetical protein